MNSLLPLYLWGVFILLLSEYGFRSRRTTMDGFEGLWRWNRAIVRILLWTGAASTIFQRWSPWILLAVGSAWILSEAGALIMRGSIHRHLNRGQAHGTPLLHLMPWLFSLAYPLLGLVLTRLTPLSPAAIRAGAALPFVSLLLSLACLWSWATVFVVSVVEITRPKQLETNIPPMVGAGEVIGILERYLTLLLVLAGGFTAIAFVITAKAAARFPQFKSREFAEYFLIGTLCSVGLSILAGLLLSAALNPPGILFP